MAAINTPKITSQGKLPHYAEVSNSFLPRAGVDYVRLRNFDYGPDRRSNISVLSPFLRHRLLHEEEVCAAVLKHHTYEQAEKFIGT
jgi:deoxyribodipyrimidine photo-lyase